MSDVISDLRFTLRSFWSHPAFTLTAVITLALGIGVNAAIFSVVNAVLLRPLPVDSPDRLVNVYTSDDTGFRHATSSFADFVDFRDQSDAFEELGAHCPMFANLEWEGRSELVMGELATSNYFRMLGVRPTLGRFFLPEEDTTELTHPVAVLGHTFWQKRFGGNPDTLGKTLSLSGTTYTIVGVAPASFNGTYAGVTADIWIPMMMVERVEPMGYHTSGPSPGNTMIERRGRRWMWIEGRLTDGVSMEAAGAQLNTIMSRLAATYPESNQDRPITVLRTDDVRIHPTLDGALQPVAALLLGVVGLVLLIACANVANMFLAKATARRKEIAVRLAIGAGRLRIIRQLLTESLALSLAGGGLGFLFSVWAIRLLLAIQPPIPMSITLDLAPDVRVFAFALAISVMTGVVFGLVPALQATRSDLVRELKGAAHTQQRRKRRLDLRSALVVSQVAISLVLLIGATLVIRSLMSAETIDPGFEPDRLAVMTFALDMQGYDEDRGKDFYRTLVERSQSLPGVLDATLSERLPFSLNIHQSSIFIGGESRPEETPISVDTTRVGIDYFDTMDVRILEGRDFGPQETEGSSPVAIVSDSMARRYWPGESAVGKLFTRLSGTTYEIVGVSGDYKVRTVGEDSRAFIHYARSQGYNPYASVLVRTEGPAVSMLGALRREAEELDPNILFIQATTMRNEMDASLFGVRAGASFLGVFGLFALFLASVGLYGVISYSVGERTKEIGTRMALGASGANVIRQVVGEGMTLVGIGVILGCLAGAALGRVLTFLLYGISPMDPASFLSAGIVLGIVALVANIIPARAASRVDPMVALRAE
jgi:macrolide transport system ATP-binding/permease protein